MSSTIKTPKLRFPGFGGEWEEKKLGELATKVGSGSTPRGGSKVYKKTGVPFVRSQNVTGGKLDMNDVVFIDEATHESMKNSAIQPNDVLLNITGASLGRTCVVPNNFKEGNLSQHVCIIRLNGTNPYLVHTVLSKPKSLQELLKTQTGGGKEGLNFQAVRAFKLTLPGKDEQQKIAGFLSTVDDRISALQKKVKLMKKYKKGIMQKIFSQQIRFKDENNKDYSAWQEKKLGDLENDGTIKLGRGDVISKIDIAETPGKYPIYSSSIHNDGLFGQYGKYMFDEELITWSVDGGGHFFYRPKQKFSVTNVSGWLRVVDNKIVCRFMSYQLQYLHEKLVFDYQTKAHPSVIRSIYTIAIPDAEEQQKIADFLTLVDEKIDLTERDLEQAKQFKKALLQQMFV